MAWGEGPYNSVISALVERKEYNTDGTGGVFDVWNYKEGRKATLGECVDCIFDHVKKLKRYQVTYRYGVGDCELFAALKLFMTGVSEWCFSCGLATVTCVAVADFGLSNSLFLIIEDVKLLLVSFIRHPLCSLELCALMICRSRKHFI
jgi:hypothetical protein